MRTVIALLFLCGFASGATITFQPGGDNPANFGDAMFLRLANGSHNRAYRNTTGQAILDFSFFLNQDVNLDGGPIFSRTQKPPRLPGSFRFFKGTGTGIPVDGAFTIQIGGLMGVESVLATPTFTGVPEPPKAALLVMAAVALVILRARTRSAGRTV